MVYTKECIDWKGIEKLIKKYNLYTDTELSFVWLF